MTIDEAIEILTDFLQDPVLAVRPDTTKSILLGIEAMKREGEYRLTAPIMNIVLLPGETRE